MKTMTVVIPDLRPPFGDIPTVYVFDLDQIADGLTTKAAEEYRRGYEIMVAQSPQAIVLKVEIPDVGLDPVAYLVAETDSRCNNRVLSAHRSLHGAAGELGRRLREEAAPHMEVFRHNPGSVVCHGPGQWSELGIVAMPLKG